MAERGREWIQSAAGLGGTEREKQCRKGTVIEDLARKLREGLYLTCSPFLILWGG